VERCDPKGEAYPFSATDVRVGKRFNRELTELPVPLIPVVVSGLAVLLACVAYFLMGEIL